MTFTCTIAQAIAATEADIRCISANLTTIQGVSTDTRTLKPFDLFFALSGENFDGHKFVNQAIAQGAIAAVVSQAWAATTKNSYPLLVVKDPLKAYQDLAHWWRSQCNLPVIAVTGSAGKTTTKELISKVLSYYQPFQVHKSRANHNNDIGVAQTLFGIDPARHGFVVVEMGMRGQGEIARLGSIATPDVSVITNIGTAHIGRLGSQAAIAQAKCELLQHLNPSSGIAVLNGEDQLLLKTASDVWHGKTLTYGLESGDIQGEFDGTMIKVSDRTWRLPLAGRHNAMNFLAALAVVQALGLDWQQIPEDLGELDLPAGRAQVHDLANDVVILDETYNASPEAVMAALHLLSQTTDKRRIAILGTMKELGEMSNQLHQQVGAVAAQLGINCLIVLTDGESDAILTGAGTNFELIQACSDRAELKTLLLGLVQPGDRILFKASHSVQMDTVVEEFRTAWSI